MPGKCIFNQKWLFDDNYKEWLDECLKDKYMASCKVCRKEINIARMGESALRTHMGGQKHRSVLETRRNGLLMSHFTSNQSASSASSAVQIDQKGKLNFPETDFAPSTESSKKPTVNSTLSNFLLKEHTQTAEILWALKCVNNHYSFNSCTGIDKLFSLMFPDSDIAKQFSCGEKKCSYICRFGLFPHFQSLLFKRLEELDNFVLLFDETLNRSLQTKQMDIYVRYWHKELNEVYTRYYMSQFMGHGTAKDILVHFVESTKKMKLSNVAQISMDGPSVNWAFYDLLQKDLIEKYGRKPLNIGTCGLHILNNSFKSGSSETDWDISTFLSSLYWLFSDSPARREDFLKVSKVGKFPLKFVKHRWLENVPSTERALELWFDFVNFVSEVNCKRIKIRKNLKSYQAVADAVSDPLMPSKLNFFLSVSKMIQPFMAFYQSDAPLLPFFATDLLRLFKQCLSNFNILKEDCLNKLTSSAKICRFDFDDNKNYTPLNAVSSGFVADKLVKTLQTSQQISEKEILSFKQDCRKFILAMLKHLAHKSPVNYSVVRNITCLDPKQMFHHSESCHLKMKRLMGDLTESKLVQEEKCETILLQFKEFMNTEGKSNPEFSGFDLLKTRLDAFFTMHMAKKSYHELWETVKILLILSHGQATVERGFSVNKKFEVENLSSESYISLRTIYDHIRFCGSIEKVELTKDLRLSVTAARQKYMKCLENEKQSKVTFSKKRVCDDELKLLSAKKLKLETDISKMHSCVKELSSKAENQRSIELFIKCNNERKVIEHLEKQLKDVISEKKCVLKNQ